MVREDENEHGGHDIFVATTAVPEGGGREACRILQRDPVLGQIRPYLVPIPFEPEHATLVSLACRSLPLMAAS